MLPYTLFPTEKGRYCLQRSQPTDVYGNCDKVSIDGFYILPDPSRDDAEKAYPIKELIQFILIPLSPERTEVEAVCSDTPPIQVYFHKELLKEIARLWPEAADSISKNLSEQLTKEEVNLDFTGNGLKESTKPSVIGEWLIVDFYLNATPLEFRNWLFEFTQNVSSEQIAYQDVVIHLKGATFPQPVGGYTFLMTIEGYLIKNGISFYIPDLIAFSVKLVKSEVLLISASGRFVMPYFIKLLDAIAEHWKEARAAIQEYKLRIRRITASMDTGALPREEKGQVEQTTKLSGEGKNKNRTERGPNLRTKIRFEVFSGIKDKHPDWPLWKVAIEAREELEEDVSAETVRNTYRLMGERWERGDRIR